MGGAAVDAGEEASEEEEAVEVEDSEVGSHPGVCPCGVCVS